MLRPPSTTAVPSAMSCLLCMRRLTRVKLTQPSQAGAMAVGIEDADVDVGMRIERGHRSVLLFERSPVVQQDADAHTAVGGSDQALYDERAGVVGVKDVVLQVERALGELDEEAARDESVEPRGEQAKSRAAAALGDAGLNPAFESSQVLGR